MEKRLGGTLSGFIQGVFLPVFHSARFALFACFAVLPSRSFLWVVLFLSSFFGLNINIHAQTPPSSLKESGFLFKTGINAPGKILSVDFVFHDGQNEEIMLTGFWMDDLSEIQFLNDFDERHPFSAVFEGTGFRKENIKCVQFDLLVRTDEKNDFWLDANYEGESDVKSPLLKGTRVSFTHEKMKRPLVPYLRERGYKEEILNTYIWITRNSSCEMGQKIYWPFLKDKSNLKPAVPVQKAFPAFTLCNPPKTIALRRARGGYVTPVIKWEYEPCDKVLIRQFSLVTLSFEKSGKNHWDLIPVDDFPKFPCH